MKDTKISILVGGIVGLFPYEVQSLLTKNKIVIDATNLSMDDLVSATIKGLNSSQSFRNDFYNLYVEKQKTINSKIENLDNLLLNDSYANLTGTEYIDIGKTVFSGATKYLGSKNDLKAAQAAADGAVKQGELTLEAQRLALEGKKIDAETALKLAQAKTGGNTMLYVGLGIGAIVILGVVVFAVTRKKS